jgi:pilus assembly protein Flp/PilA
MFDLVRTFLRDENGATAIEYGLIAALIAVAIIAGATAVGTSLSGTFNTVATSL